MKLKGILSTCCSMTDLKSQYHQIMTLIILTYLLLEGRLSESPAKC
jgi:hypothetical protein